MSEFTVNMTGHISGSVRVEADDPGGAIEEVMIEGLPPICAQCSGWGADRRWSKEEGEEWAETSVTDAEGNTVWTGPDYTTQRVTAELADVAGLVDAAADVAQAAAIIRNRIAEIKNTR